MENEFEKMYAINVNEHTDKKNGLTYLSWAWAWAEFKKVYPDATYKIWRDEHGLPYVFDPNLGYMVFTRVTANGLTHEMWLFVMDNKNNAMKNVKYKVTKGRYTSDVEPATMFDINTAIMRCLTKNLAMFGLGLYIYAGEDLPEEEQNGDAPKEKKSTNEDAKVLQGKIEEYAHAHNMTVREVCRDYGINVHTDAKKLQEVYDDLTSKSTSNSNASTESADKSTESEQTSMEANFEAIDEKLPWKE